MHDQPTFAWHFLSSDGRLRDGTLAPPDGEVLYYAAGKVVICYSGLHASERLIDALRYAPGLTLCRVACLDVVTRQEDKFVCRGREILWRLPPEVTHRVLLAFAYWCAERAARYATTAAATAAAYAAYATARDAAHAARYAADAARYADAAARYADAAARYADAAHAARYAAATARYAQYAAGAASERKAQETELVRLVDLARGAT